MLLCTALIGCGESASTEKAEEHEEEGFVMITDVIPDAILEIRYYSTFIFMGEWINAYEAPAAFVIKEAAAALVEII